MRDNLACGVVEPAISKIKSFRFATEAAITILRIGKRRHVCFVWSPVPRFSVYRTRRDIVADALPRAQGGVLETPMCAGTETM